MKKQWKFFLTAICIGVVVIFVLLIWRSITTVDTYVNAPKQIQRTGIHSANNRQPKPSVWIGEYGGNLYFYSPHALKSTNFNEYLCIISEESVTKLHRLKKSSSGYVLIVGAIDQYFYYWACEGYQTAGIDKLYCYDLESMVETLLYEGSTTNQNTLFFHEDGTVYIPLTPNYGETPQFLQVSGNSVLGVGPLNHGYSIGDRTYYVIAEYSDLSLERIMSTDDCGKMEEIELGKGAQGRAIIPCENGLLIHNEGSEELLYWIDEDGKLLKLLDVPCLSVFSAVNVCGTDAYVSFKRYEKYGEIGMLRYENDTLEGTYRISLMDYSIVKINDKIFNGMYNFDDTGFYCCDEDGKIYKMEFNGSCTLIFSEK